MPGQKAGHAEGVALSGVPVNTRPHADTTLEMLIQLRAEGARAQTLISQAKGQGRSQAVIPSAQQCFICVLHIVIINRPTENELLQAGFNVQFLRKQKKKMFPDAKKSQMREFGVRGDAR